MATFTEPFDNQDDISSLVGSEVTSGTLRNAELIGEDQLQFSGGTDYVNCGDISEFDSVSTMTLSAWIKPDILTASFEGLVTRRNLSGWVWAVASSGRLAFYDNGWRYSSSNVLTAGVWQHVAITYSGSGIVFYVNGVQVSTSIVGTKPNTSGIDVQIGTWDLGAYGFDGTIAEVAMYNDVRTPSEIFAEYVTGVDTSAGNLVSYWKLNEGTGTTVEDLVSSYDGTLTNSPSWVTGYSIFASRSETISNQLVTSKDLNTFDYLLERKGGDTLQRLQFSDDNGTTFKNHLGDDLDVGSYYFDGDNDYISASDSDDFTSNTFTEMVWFKCNPLSGNGHLFGHYIETTNNRSWSSYVLTTGAVFCSVYDNGTSSDLKNYQTVETFDDGKWHHLAVTFSTSTQDYKIYVDGIERTVTKNADDNIADVHNASGNLYLGRTEGGNYFEGYLADARFYSEVLTATDIWNYYAYAVEPDNTNLKVRYKMNGNANDSSGNGHNGTVSGAVNSTDFFNTPSLGYSTISSTDAQVIDFDGSNDEVIVSDSNSLSFTSAGQDQPFSISAWVKPEGFSASLNTIIAKRQGGSAEWMLGYTSSAVYFWTYKSNVSGAIGLTTPYTFKTNKWYHIYATYSGSESYTGFKVYVNGVLLSQTSGGFGTGYTGMANTSAEVNIGSLDSITNYFHNGIIANIALWNDERTSAEAVEDFYNGYIDTSDANLVSYWALSENYNDPIGSNNGTNNGTTTKKDIYRPLPSVPTQTEIDISALTSADFAWNVRGDSNFLNTPSLDLLELDYLGGTRIMMIQNSP